MYESKDFYKHLLEFESKTLNFFAKLHSKHRISCGDIGNAHFEEKTEKIFLVNSPCGESQSIFTKHLIVFFRDHAISNVKKRTAILFVRGDTVVDLLSGPHTTPNITAERKRKLAVIVASACKYDTAIQCKFFCLSHDGLKQTFCFDIDIHMKIFRRCNKGKAFSERYASIGIFGNVMR